MSKQDAVARARAAHHTSLESLAPGQDGLTVWRRLRRLEAKAHRLAEDVCNRGVPDWEEQKDAIRKDVAKAFGGTLPKGFLLNGDPRGYALKLDPEETTIPEGMHKDWGGYGILAPVID